MRALPIRRKHKRRGDWESDTPEGETPLIVGCIGPYRLERILATGSSGRVYLARHETLGRRVAVKVLSPSLASDSESVSRFFCEARAIAGIGHEHLVNVFDFLFEPEQSMIAFVMEHLAGQDLARILARQGPLAPIRVSHIGAQICDALAAVHALGTIHRDIKPDNVMLIRRGGDPDFVKVLDFGIAQFHDRVGHRTAAGTAFGSPAYMSPEQVRHGRIDGRSDLYSLGCLLHELLSGRPPFLAPTIHGTLAMHVTATPPVLTQDYGAGPISPRLVQIVRRCLSKDPRERPRSADHLRDELLDAACLVDNPAEKTQILRQRVTPRHDLSGALLFSFGLISGALLLALLQAAL